MGSSSKGATEQWTLQPVTSSGGDSSAGKPVGSDNASGFEQPQSSGSQAQMTLDQQQRMWSAFQGALAGMLTGSPMLTAAGAGAGYKMGGIADGGAGEFAVLDNARFTDDPPTQQGATGRAQRGPMQGGSILGGDSDDDFWGR